MYFFIQLVNYRSFMTIIPNRLINHTENKKGQYSKAYKALDEAIYKYTAIVKAVILSKKVAIRSLLHQK